MKKTTRFFFYLLNVITVIVAMGCSAFSENAVYEKIQISNEAIEVSAKSEQDFVFAKIGDTIDYNEDKYGQLVDIKQLGENEEPVHFQYSFLAGKNKVIYFVKNNIVSEVWFEPKDSHDYTKKQAEKDASVFLYKDSKLMEEFHNGYISKNKADVNEYKSKELSQSQILKLVAEGFQVPDDGISYYATFLYSEPKESLVQVRIGLTTDYLE